MVIKVSIIVPVFNVAPYIRDCIYSIINQSVSPYECIIVDDCGCDESMCLCDEIISRYLGPIIFKVIHHERNRGLSAARNTGVTNSTGNYIFFCDSDDRLLPDCIKALTAAVMKHPDVEMVQGGIKTDSKSKLFTLSSLRELDYIENKDWMREFYFNPFNYFPMTAWNKLLKKEFILHNKLQFKEGLIHEDHLWMFWLCKYVSKIAIVHDSTYYYLIRANSITSCPSGIKSLRNWKIIFEEVFNNFEEPFYNKELLFYFNKLLILYKYKQECSEELFQIEKRFKYEFKKRHLYILFCLYIPQLCMVNIYKKVLNFLVYIYFKFSR